MEIHNCAVVADDSSFVDLFISKGVGVTNSIAKAKGSSIRVPAKRYQDVIGCATVVKIDVEGAEYSYPIVENLEHLRAITIEWHPISGNPKWREQCNELMNRIEQRGFDCLYRPSFSHGWDCNCAFVRSSQ